MIIEISVLISIETDLLRAIVFAAELSICTVVDSNQTTLSSQGFELAHVIAIIYYFCVLQTIAVLLMSIAQAEVDSLVSLHPKQSALSEERRYWANNRQE